MYALTCTMKSRPSAALWDLISGLLYQFHSQGIEEGEEPAPTGESALVEANEFELALEPGVLLPPEKFSAYFENLRDAERAQRAIESHLVDLSPAFVVHEVEEKNYIELWKENFHPISVPPCWLIRAPWHDTRAKKGELELIIEPGMAFGTGSHETTKACLELMADVVKKTKLGPNSKALDFGCGSGILAIGLRKLGVGTVFGIDIDPLSIESSRQNAQVNQVSIHVNLSSSENPRDFRDFDCIVANILKNTLLEFAPSFYSWLKPKGSLILSGLLIEQEKVILEAYKKLGFSEIKRIVNGPIPADVHNTWISLWLQK